MLPADLKIEDALDELGKVIPRLTEQKKRSIKQEAEQRAAFSDIMVADDLDLGRVRRSQRAVRWNSAASRPSGRAALLSAAGRILPHRSAMSRKANDKDTMAIIESEMAKTGESPEST